MDVGEWLGDKVSGVGRKDYDGLRRRERRGVRNGGLADARP